MKCVCAARIILVCFFLYKSSEAECTYPSDLRGTWVSSDFDQVVFSDTFMYMPSYDITTSTVSGTPSNFSCDFQFASLYVSRSTTTYTSPSVSSYFWYICLELTAITSVSYYYYKTESNNAGLGYNFTQYMQSCTQNQNIELFHVFVKKGFESNALSYCAMPLLGIFTYTRIDASSTVSTCDLNTGDSSLDVCNNNKTNLIFDLSLCSTQMSFSAGGHVGCVAALSSGETYYQSLINLDTTVSSLTNTYRFTCLVLQLNGTDVQATEKAGDCSSEQSATVKPAFPGGLLYFAANNLETSSSEDNSDSNIDVIVGIVTSLLLVIIIATISIFVFKVYQKKIAERKPFKKSRILPVKDSPESPHHNLNNAQGELMSINEEVQTETDRNPEDDTENKIQSSILCVNEEKPSTSKGNKSKPEPLAVTTHSVTSYGVNSGEMHETMKAVSKTEFEKGKPNTALEVVPAYFISGGLESRRKALHSDTFIEKIPWTSDEISGSGRDLLVEPSERMNSIGPRDHTLTEMKV